jgi:hypothetical protein
VIIVLSLALVVGAVLRAAGKKQTDRFWAGVLFVCTLILWAAFR